MLTFRCAGSVSAASCAARIGAVVVLLVMTWSSAFADWMSVGSCVGGWAASNCVARWGPAGNPYVRSVPEPDQAEKALATERDHRWLDRCRPVIVQDRYGVPRYRYSAPGCEFGVIE